MSENEIPEIIIELLKPISGNSPSGEDIAKSEDPVDNAAYSGLEMEISELSNVDYKSLAHKAIDILKNKSKHMRVASWLCLCWLKLEKIEGFRNGLLLLSELLKNYGDRLYPEKPAQRSKALQYVNTEKRFRLIEKIEIIPENSAVIIEVENLFKEIQKQSETRFSDSPPNLTDIYNIIQEKAKTARTNKGEKSVEKETEKKVKIEVAEDETKKLKNIDESTESSEKITEGKPVEIKEKINNKEIQQDDEFVKEKESDEEKPPESDEIKFEIPDEVTGLLEDISAESPVGEDAEQSDEQDTMVLYMNLETEMGKMGNNDYEQCVKLATEILQERSKHLRVAIWLCISWFRSEADNEVNRLTAFKNGLLLINKLLRKFGDSLFPQHDIQKSKIIKTLNTDSRLKLLQKIEVNEKNSEIISEIGKVFQALVLETDTRFSENPPRLTDISKLIDDKAQEANEHLKKQKEVTDEKSFEETPTAEDKTGVESTVKRAVVDKPISKDIQAVSSDKDAKLSIKNSLLFFFEGDNSDKDNRKVPLDESVYGLSRVYRWGKLGIPQEKEKITQIEAPSQIIQDRMQKLLTSKDFDTLIPTIEINFLKNDSFLYWLDAQRYVVIALEQKGGQSLDASLEIKGHLSRLIARLPKITELKFKDKKTSFASAETNGWLEDEIQNIFGSSKAKEKILPPIIGEDYDPINKQYETACDELPSNFEKNAKSMQDAIAGDVRVKGRFLRLINLANYCYLAKQYSIARVHFNKLIENIRDLNIIDWERSLCVSVYRSTYLNNRKLLSTDSDHPQKSIIEQQQIELFDKIGNYDSVLALNLLNHHKKEGE